MSFEQLSLEGCCRRRCCCPPLTLCGLLRHLLGCGFIRLRLLLRLLGWLLLCTGGRSGGRSSSNRYRRCSLAACGLKLMWLSWLPCMLVSATPGPLAAPGWLLGPASGALAVAGLELLGWRRRLLPRLLLHLRVLHGRVEGLARRPAPLKDRPCHCF